MYTRFIRGVRHQQQVRGTQILHIITGEDASTDPAPVDWLELEAGSSPMDPAL